MVTTAGGGFRMSGSSAKSVGRACSTTVRAIHGDCTLARRASSASIRGEGASWSSCVELGGPEILGFKTQMGSAENFDEQRFGGA